MSRAVAGRLRSDGHAVDEVDTLRDARSALADVDYDCLVFDRLVPDGDSLDLLADLDRDNGSAAVLVLSALGDADQRVRGLRAGAHDYVSKPVRLDELALRVRKLLVRRGAKVRRPVTLGPVLVDRDRREVTVHGSPVELTPHQWKLFTYLVTHRHRVVTTSELLEHCWDRNDEMTSNPLHPHLSRLRRTFRGVLRFDSIRGRGYKLEVVDPEPAPRRR